MDLTTDHSWLEPVRTDSGSRATRAAGAAVTADASETQAKRRAMIRN